MSFPRYPAYKDSGVEWLGEVPKHWHVAPFKHYIERNDGGVWGDEPTGECDTIVLRSTEQTVDGRWAIDDPAPRHLTPAEKEAALLSAGDLLVTKSSGSALHIGKTTLVTDEIAAMQCCYSNFMQRLRTTPEFTPALGWWLMNSPVARLQFDLLSNSTTGLANLNGTIIGQMMIAVPPPAEQAAIVAFLDRETGKIDALIAEQERLIELLKEKRQAVISHAVTKGLDPDVPMKDSGVEWLGEVPAHWEVVRLKRAVMFQRGHDLPEESRSEGEFPVVSSAGVIGTHDTAQAKGPGIVTGRYGSIGRFTLMEEDYWPLNTALYSIELYDNQPRYIWYLLQSTSEHFVLNSLKSAVPGVDRNDIHVVQVAVPARREQEQIALYLDRHCSTSNELVEQAEDAIALLQERRAALISAAVTGQIDVRDAAPTR